VVKDKRAQRTVHVSTADEDLRPVRAAEVEKVPLAKWDRPPVLTPA
jgi:hypothetical protein